MYVYIYIYIYTCIHTLNVYVCMYVCTHTCIYIYIYMCIYIYIYIHIHTERERETYIYIYIYIHTHTLSIYTYIYIYIYIYTPIYIHTYTFLGCWSTYGILCSNSLFGLYGDWCVSFGWFCCFGFGELLKHVRLIVSYSIMWISLNPILLLQVPCKSHPDEAMLVLVCSNLSSESQLLTVTVHWTARLCESELLDLRPTLAR